MVGDGKETACKIEKIKWVILVEVKRTNYKIKLTI